MTTAISTLLQLHITHLLQSRIFSSSATSVPAERSGPSLCLNCSADVAVLLKRLSNERTDARTGPATVLIGKDLAM